MGKILGNFLEKMDEQLNEIIRREEANLYKPKFVRQNTEEVERVRYRANSKKPERPSFEVEK